MKPYRELPLVNSEQTAIVDLEDYLRLNRYRWHLMRVGKYSYVYRLRCMAGRSTQIMLHHAVLDLPRGVRVRRINKETLDYRRANLKITDGSIYRNPHSKRCPFAVCITIDGKHFYVGSWPTKEWAKRARDAAAEAAKTLRGRGLSERAIQRELDLAAGRDVRKKAA
jgi:hypothetical protein